MDYNSKVVEVFDITPRNPRLKVRAKENSDVLPNYERVNASQDQNQKPD